MANKSGYSVLMCAAPVNLIHRRPTAHPHARSTSQSPGLLPAALHGTLFVLQESYHGGALDKRLTVCYNKGVDEIGDNNNTYKEYRCYQ